MPIVPDPAFSVRTDYDDFPIPRDMVPILIQLVEWEYSPEAIGAIRSHLGLHGTAEGCSWIDREHRQAVEALLPVDPAWDSPRWDADRFAPGPRG